MYESAPTEGLVARLAQAVLRRPLAAGLILGLVVALPTIWAPLYYDDDLQHLALDAYLAPEKAPHQMFRDAVDPFGLVNVYHGLDGDAARTSSYRDDGAVAWWVWPEARGVFYRPLASLAALADRVLFGDAWPAYHLHSLLWWLALLAGLGVLLRDVCGTSRLWPLALALFAISDAHFMPVAWLANRHALISASGCVWALMAHWRWRERGWVPGLPLSLLGLAIGLAGGESAVAGFAFLGAYELLSAGPRPAFGRLRYTLPALALLATWAVFYRQHHFGTYGISFYLDPIHEAADFWPAAPGRYASLVLAYFAGLPSELWMVEALHPFLVGLGVITMAAVAGCSWRAWRQLDEPERRTARWLGLGGLLAMIPSLSVLPGNRNLLIPGFGLTWITAALIRHAWRPDPGGGAVRFYGRLLALRHGLVPWLAWPLLLATLFLHSAAGAAATAAAELPDDPGAPLLILQIAAGANAVVRVQALVSGRRGMGSWYVASVAEEAHRLRRVDATTLTLSGPGLLDSFAVRAIRPDAYPYHVGDRIQLRGHRVDIAAMSGDQVTELRITFDVPPDDGIRPPAPGAFTLMAWQDGKLRRLRPPAIGDSLDLPWSPGPRGL